MKRLLILIMALALSAGLLTPASAAGTRVSKLMEEMSLREKILQMMMVDFRHWDEDPADAAPAADFTVMNDQVAQILEDYNFGAVIYFAQNLIGTQQAYELTAALQRSAVQGGGIPMLISADQEGGSVYRLSSGTALPGNMALGAAHDPEYARAAGEIIGSELSALGINTCLSPVVDVNNNPNNPVIGLRSYSDDPALVGQLAAAAIKGMGAHNVIACAKHFPGHGDTAADSHYALPVVDKPLEVLQDCELAPYKAAIEAGTDMIMTAHILYPQLEGDTLLSRKTGRAEALPATMSDDILTGLLKEEMGFEGIVVTDAMNMAGITDCWGSVQAIVTAIGAGADMICMPCSLHSTWDLEQLEAILAGVEQAVEEGELPLSRIDDAVARILTVKERRGVLDWNEGARTLAQALSTVGGAENRAAERRLAAAAVTVVQNKNSTLPLRLNGQSKVLMMVPYENEKAQMLMGWNRAAQAGLVPEGAQVKAVCFGESSTLDAFRSELAWADTVILNSEVGSAAGLNGGSWRCAFPMAVVEYAEKAGKVSIVQSVDKPYDVQCYPNADAVAAVYGCKGSSVDPTQALVGGVTDSETACGPNIIAGIEVILGVFEARGTLPVDIPRLVNGAFGDEILFPRGFGLTYPGLLSPQVTEQTEEMPEQPVEAPLPEEENIPQPQPLPEEPQQSSPPLSTAQTPAADSAPPVFLAGAALLLCAAAAVLLRKKK